MQSDKLFIKNFIVLAVVFGAVGTAVFAGISHAIEVLGFIPLQLFLAIYFAITINLSFVLGISYNVKQYALERFVKTYPQKHGEGFELYDSLVKSQEHVNQLIEEYVKTSEVANYNNIAQFQNYKNILKQQEKHNKLLEKVNELPEKEISAFHKFCKLTKIIALLTFKDTHFEQHFNIKTTAQKSQRQALAQSEKSASHTTAQEQMQEQELEQENYLNSLEKIKKIMMENEKNL